MINAYYKLVRNKVPDLIKKQNKIPLYKTIKDEDYKYYLKLKLKEEVDELIRKSDKIGITENLVDVYEILNCLKKEYKILEPEVKNATIKKNKEKGNFDKKIFLVLTEE